MNFRQQLIMPLQVQVAIAHVNIVNIHQANIEANDEDMVQDKGTWTRRRLIKEPDGSWKRIGRLHRVFYKT